MEVQTAPRTFPLGWDPDAPGDPPTLEEFKQIKRERCRELMAAERLKALAAAVYTEVGDAARTALARHGLTVEPDGTITSAVEAEVHADWRELVSALYAVHGAALKLPRDTRMNPATGAVIVTPMSHDHDRGGGGTDDVLAGHV